MKILIYTIIAITALTAAMACSSPKEEKKDVRSEELYRKQCALTRLYTDSLKNTPDSVFSDSATVWGMMDRYRIAAERLNMQYPPEADREIPEDWNDTIYLLTKKLTEEYKRHIFPADSIPLDSIPPLLRRPEGK